ncbi:AMP-binding protein [Saccharothrix lopnurensis]|uniref:AMP-binding protein n=1 Tax=Saccharothrix lopnurensis TaxID=1670621 RepID=A0ABW1PDZ0_9PSEU
MSAYTTPEEYFGAATVPEAVERAARGGRGITLLDVSLAETPLPYSLLARSARRVATALAGLGVRPGDRVALISRTDARLLLSLFGVWRAGAVPTVLAPPHRLSGLPGLVADLRHRLDQVDARCVVVADPFGEFLAKRLGRQVTTCGELTARRADLAPPITTDPDEPAYLQFTSGTTGPSKAVVLTHRQLLTNAVVCCERLLLDGAGSVHASWAPLYHDLGLVAVVSCAAAGVGLVLQSPEAFLASPDSWVDAMSRYRATSTVSPGFAYGLAATGMRDRPRALDLSALRVCGDGSEPTRREAVEAFTEQGARYGLRPEAVTPMYGLAEATLSVSMGSLSEPLLWDHVRRDALSSRGVAEVVPAHVPGARSLAVVGHPVPGVDLRVVGACGEPLPDRAVGEVCVRGPSLMLGYWQDPVATAEAVRDGWLRTGDLGYLTPAGLVVCGRVKDMIIVGGANLYPEDYEHVASRADGARATCAAFSEPGAERMVVVVEPVDGGDPARVAERVMDRLREELGHAPDRVVVVGRGSIPRTSSGKVQRERCRARYFGGELPVVADLPR